MILQSVTLSGSMTFDDMEASILAGVAQGSRITPVVDRELLLGCVLHEARIVIAGWDMAAVWVWFANRQGAMKAGRVQALRRGRARGETVTRPYLVNQQSVTGIDGAWWRGIVGALSRRGGLAEGYAERRDYVAADRTRVQRNPLVVAPYELKRAIAMHEAASAYAAQARPEHATAAARYLSDAAAYLAAAQQDYTAVTGLQP